uniref:Uncharacterized protein n=1 Tax=Globodera rostochiensis TaxID=31243 RepID=A0A914HM54_GLORO
MTPGCSSPTSHAIHLEWLDELLIPNAQPGRGQLSRRPKGEAESRSAGILCLHFHSWEIHPLHLRIEDDPMGKGEL